MCYGKISMYIFIFKRKYEKYPTLAKMAALCLHLELWEMFDSPPLIHVYETSIMTLTFNLCFIICEFDLD